MFRICLLLFLPSVLFGQSDRTQIDSLIAMPYDEMVADLRESEQQLNQGISQALQVQHPVGVAELKSRLSIVTYLLGKHELSLQHGVDAIELFESFDLPVKAAGVYCSLGYQLKRRDMEKANAYMRQGIAILEKWNEVAHLESAYSNYGVLKEMENQLDSASVFYARAYEIALDKRDSVAIPFSLNHLAGIALLKEDFPKAKSFFDQAYSIRYTRKDDFGILENLIFYGDLFTAMNRADSATHYYRQAINLSYSVGFPYMRQYCFEQLAKVYKTSGNTAAAFENQKAFSLLKDSLLEMQRTEQLAEMETRFETAQKEKENLLLKQRTQAQQLVVSRQRSWIFGLAAVALAVLFLAVFFLQRNKRLAESRRNEAIIQEREHGLRSIIQATEEERKRIAKDLHDGIVQSLTGLSLRMQKLIVIQRKILNSR